MFDDNTVYTIASAQEVATTKGETNVRRVAKLCEKWKDYGLSRTYTGRQLNGIMLFFTHDTAVPFVAATCFYVVDHLPDVDMCKMLEEPVARKDAHGIITACLALRMMIAGMSVEMSYRMFNNPSGRKVVSLMVKHFPYNVANAKINGDNAVNIVIAFVEVAIGSDNADFMAAVRHVVPSCIGKDDDIANPQSIFAKVYTVIMFLARVRIFSLSLAAVQKMDPHDVIMLAEELFTRFHHTTEPRSNEELRESTNTVLEYVSHHLTDSTGNSASALDDTVLAPHAVSLCNDLGRGSCTGGADAETVASCACYYLLGIPDDCASWTVGREKEMLDVIVPVIADSTPEKCESIISRGPHAPKMITAVLCRHANGDPVVLAQMLATLHWLDMTRCVDVGWVTKIADMVATHGMLNDLPRQWVGTVLGLPEE